MSEILKCSQCGNKLRQFPGARFTICSYCGYQTNFEQPKPAPVYNDFSNHSTETVYNYQSGLALLTLFTVGFALPILQTFFVAKSLKNGYWSRHKVFGALAIAATWITFFAFIYLLAVYGLWGLWLFVVWIIGFLAWRAKK